MKDLQKAYQDWQKEQMNLSSEFVSAWLDNRGRPCCFGIFDEGYPQSVTMEYLTIENKQWLYQILQKTLDKLKTDSNDKSRRCVMDTNNVKKGMQDTVWVITEDYGQDDGMGVVRRH